MVVPRQGTIFSDQLAVDDDLPADATIACTLLAANDAAGVTVTVDTSVPDGVKATDGTTTFTVFDKQLIIQAQPTRDDDASTPVCPTCDGTESRSRRVSKGAQLAAYRPRSLRCPAVP